MDLVAGEPFKVGGRSLLLKMIRYESQSGPHITARASLRVIEEGRVLKGFSRGNGCPREEAAKLKAELETWAPKLIEQLQRGEIPLPENSASCLSEFSEI